MYHVTVRIKKQTDRIEFRFILRGVQHLAPPENPFTRKGNYLHDRFGDGTITHGHMLSQRFRGIHGVTSVLISSDECVVGVDRRVDIDHVVERLAENIAFVLRMATPWVIMRTDDGTDWRYRFGTNLLQNGTHRLSGATVESGRGLYTPFGWNIYHSIPWSQLGIGVNAVFPYEVKLAPHHDPAHTDWRILDTYTVQHVAHAVGTRAVHVDWTQ